jgi:hypothetical protein
LGKFSGKVRTGRTLHSGDITVLATNRGRHSIVRRGKGMVNDRIKIEHPPACPVINQKPTRSAAVPLSAHCLALLTSHFAGRSEPCRLLAENQKLKAKAPGGGTNLARSSSNAPTFTLPDAASLIETSVAYSQPAASPSPSR